MPCGIEDRLTVLYPFAVSSYCEQGIAGLRVLDMMTYELKFKFLCAQTEFIELVGYSQSKLLINQERNHLSTYDLKD